MVHRSTTATSSCRLRDATSTDVTRMAAGCSTVVSVGQAGRASRLWVLTSGAGQGRGDHHRGRPQCEVPGNCMGLWVSPYGSEAGSLAVGVWVSATHRLPAQSETNRRCACLSTGTDATRRDRQLDWFVYRQFCCGVDSCNAGRVVAADVDEVLLVGGESERARCQDNGSAGDLVGGHVDGDQPVWFTARRGHTRSNATWTTSRSPLRKPASQ